MAKLPGINYGAGVPSLGREDPMGPVRAANAEARALAKIGSVTQKIANDIYEANALTEETDAWNKYEEEMLAQETQMANTPYTTDEETGEVYPNYHSLPKAYGETEKTVREQSMSGMNNASAKKRVAIRMEERRIKGQHGANQQAIAWMNEEGQRVGMKDVETQVRLGNIEAARQNLKDFANVYTPAQKAGITTYIDGKEAYQSVQSELIADDLAIGDIHAIREQLTDINDPRTILMDPKDVADLKTAANEMVEDTLGSVVHLSYKAGGGGNSGLAAIEKAIQVVNQSSLEDFSFENERHKQQTLSFMRNVQADYLTMRETAVKANDMDLRWQEMLNGSLPDPNETSDWNKNDLRIINERLYRPAVAGMAPLSEEWTATVVGLTENLGWPPQEAMGQISAALHAADPRGAVVAAAALKQVIDANPSHPGVTINEKDLDFAYWLNGMESRGTATEQAIDEYRNGIAKLSATEKAASAAVVASYKPEELKKLIDEVLDDTPGMDAWFSYQAEPTATFTHDVLANFRHYMPLMANMPEAAMARAVATTLNVYGTTDHGSGITIMRNAPENVIKGKQGEVRKWTDEDFVKKMSALDYDPDDLGRAYIGMDPEGNHSWAVTNSDTGDMLVDKYGDPVTHTPVFATSPEGNRIQRTQDKAINQAAVNAELGDKRSRYLYREPGVASDFYDEEGYSTGFQQGWLIKGARWADNLSTLEETTMYNLWGKDFANMDERMQHVSDQEDAIRQRVGIMMGDTEIAN